MSNLPEVQFTDPASLKWFTSILASEGLLEPPQPKHISENRTNEKQNFLSFDSIRRSARQIKARDD